MTRSRGTDPGLPLNRRSNPGSVPDSWTGADTFAMGRVGAHRATFRFVPKQTPERGGTAWIVPELTAATRFDPQTEQRI